MKKYNFAVINFDPSKWNPKPFCYLINEDHTFEIEADDEDAAFSLGIRQFNFNFPSENLDEYVFHLVEK